MSHIQTGERLCRRRDGWCSSPPERLRSSWLSATCEPVGCSDERFLPCSEKMNYANRVRAAGYRVEYLPTARARHTDADSGRLARLAPVVVGRIRYIKNLAGGPGSIGRSRTCTSGPILLSCDLAGQYYSLGWAPHQLMIMTACHS
jgi:hypothetical protein